MAVSWFRSRRSRNDESLPVNTEFSSVTGAIVLTSGQTVEFRAIVPTVFNGTVFPGSAVGAIPQREETADFALQVAQDAYPGCQWHSVGDVDIVPATPEQSAWALANGVNERFS